MDGDQGALNKFTHGEILAGIHDLVVSGKALFARLPSWTQKFIATEAKPEAAILEGLVPVAVTDIIAGGFKTASFITAGKGVLAKLIAQNVTTYTMQSVMANLNMAVATDPAAQAALAALTGSASAAAQPGSAAQNIGA